MKHKRYSHDEIHTALHCTCSVEYFKNKMQIDPMRQAYACPYYIPLKGILGSDWGVIVNPDSERFGEVVFEHDDCDCVGSCPRGKQKRDEWLEKAR